MLLSPGPVSAHDELAASVPAEGSTVTSAPQRILLTFAGPVKTSYVTVAVTGPGGDTFQSGQPTVDDRVVTQVLKPLTSGDYIAAYQVISTDGHPITGRVQFSLALPGTSSPAAPAAASSLPAAAVASTTLPSMWLWVGAAVLIAGLGGAGVAWSRRRAR
ncbi:copper resistance CopC family protein [Catellatospora methionotrophica]|uniref:copper resistance CopC family protein n=1 Tax=Catellatospora methionotrophica TaxID=121620 RepID=UPI0033F56EB3